MGGNRSEIQLPSHSMSLLSLPLPIIYETKRAVSIAVKFHRPEPTPCRNWYATSIEPFLVRHPAVFQVRWREPHYWHCHTNWTQPSLGISTNGEA